MISRERLALDRNVAPRRNQIEDLALEQIRAGVDFVRSALRPFGGFSTKAVMRPSASWTTQPNARRIVDANEVQRPMPPFSLMVLTHRAQIEARENVAVEHEERAGDVLLDVLERAGRAERRLLDHVRDLHAEARAVAEVIDDRLRHVAGREDHVANLGRVEPLHRPRQETARS